MTTTPMPPKATPAPPGGAPAAVKTNALGLGRVDYKGGDSTLCNGCGHDAISAAIISACYEIGMKPEGMIKLSGIGCSSKSPAYFMNRSHGINTLHGRMPSVATGALMANHSLNAIGVSGDGDTGSIGMGQFKHMVRRNVRMVYVIENNGVYGLTKGQFSATSDYGAELKHAGKNELPPIDLCMEAIIAGCGFVARSFSGDPKQLVPLLKAAFSHRGTAVLDVISPCVTFNNHDSSTKSYAYGRDHDIRVNDVGYVPPADDIQIEEYDEMKDVTLHDGSLITLRKADRSHNPTDRTSALALLLDAQAKQEFITGLLYVDNSRPGLSEVERLSTPLAHLSDDKLRPNRASLDKIIATMK